MDITRQGQSDGSDFAELLARVRRHWWLVALLGVAGMAGAAVIVAHQPKVYEASTSVLVQPVSAGQDTSVAGGRTRGDLNLDTEAQLVQSTAVATEAGKLLRVTTPPDQLAVGVTVDVPANTSVLVVTYAAATPARAQAGSHAFAQAYLQNRQDSAAADLAGQLATVNNKLQQLNGQLAQINVQLAAASPQSATKANLDSQRSTVVTQINTLTGRANFAPLLARDAVAARLFVLTAVAVMA